jgi:malate dehydrogenase (oxaloacetate-decarboxylating)(NADP+)
VLYAEGESERVLRAVQAVVDENLARPILIGRPAVIDMRILRPRLRPAVISTWSIESDSRYRELWQDYYRLMGREGVTPTPPARPCAPTPPDRLHAAAPGDADALICGTTGPTTSTSPRREPDRPEARRQPVCGHEHPAAAQRVLASPTPT